MVRDWNREMSELRNRAHDPGERSNDPGERVQSELTENRAPTITLTEDEFLSAIQDSWNKAHTDDIQDRLARIEKMVTDIYHIMTTPPIVVPKYEYLSDEERSNPEVVEKLREQLFNHTDSYFYPPEPDTNV